MSGVKPSPGSSLQQKLLKVAAGREISALADQALVSGANFITNIIIARVLGVHDYGVFALAWMAVLFVNSIQTAFIISPMVSVGPKQETPQRPTYYGAVLTHEYLFVSICAIVIIAASLLAGWKFPQWEVGGLALPLSFAAVTYLLQDFVRRYLFSVRKSSGALVSDLVSYLTQVPILLGMAYWHRMTIQGALWVIGATSLAGYVVGYLRFEARRFDYAVLRAVTARHWTISRWLAPSAFMQWSSGNLIVLAAPMYFGVAAAGVLRAAQNIVAVAHIWFLGLDNVVPAEAAHRVRSGGAEASFRYVRQIILLWGSITAVFMSLIIAFPGFWLNIVYGAKFAGYGNVLQLYAVLYFLVFFGSPLKAGLQALEYTSPVFWSYSAMTIFSLFFVTVVAKHLGIAGVMVGLIVTQVMFQSIMSVGLVMRVRSLRTAALANQ